MKLLLFGTIMFLSGAISAAPQAQSSEECRVYADVAIVARALAMDALSETMRARILDGIYSVAISRAGEEERARINKIVMLINQAAAKYPDSAYDYAQTLGLVCMNRRGNMDSILGGTDS